jgi:hypothetical protein
MATEKVENSSPGFAAPLLILAWAVVLLIAFFANRGGDVGQLGKLIGNLGGGPLFGWQGFKDSFVGGLIALAVVLTWFGLGSLITKFVRRERSDVTNRNLNYAVDLCYDIFIITKWKEIYDDFFPYITWACLCCRIRGQNTACCYGFCCKI